MGDKTLKVFAFHGSVFQLYQQLLLFPKKQTMIFRTGVMNNTPVAKNVFSILLQIGSFYFIS